MQIGNSASPPRLFFLCLYVIGIPLAGPAGIGACHIPAPVFLLRHLTPNRIYLRVENVTTDKPHNGILHCGAIPSG
jgi:hypothetical protein